MTEVVEWAVDYRDGCGPRQASDEWTARNWVRYWNDHREDQELAVLVMRTVVTSEWRSEADSGASQGDVA